MAVNLNIQLRRRKMKTLSWFPIALIAIGAILISSANAKADGNGLRLGVVCQDQTVTQASPKFNIDAICPAGQVVVTGGYACFDTDGDVLPVEVDENTLFFSNVTPTGWQSVGHVMTFEDPTEAAKCRVCATCSQGSCQDTSKNSVCAPVTKKSEED
jgi:hypothetical protein